jgi:hypothetical protein
MCSDVIRFGPADGPWVRGFPNLQNSKINCGLFRTVICCSDSRNMLADYVGENYMTASICLYATAIVSPVLHNSQVSLNSKNV